MSKKADERPSEVPSSLSPSDPLHEAKTVDDGKLELPADDISRRRRRAKAGVGTLSGDLNGQFQTPHGVIGDGLRRLFNEIVEEPIPADFLHLLEKIDHKGEA
jgi:Anti-sigma factor NepR